jgi:mRNA-degrading endonuclease RelE of RelBE toxin-antitoxin system
VDEVITVDPSETEVPAAWRGTGRYRVLFDYDGEVRIVEIQEVKKCDERTC